MASPKTATAITPSIIAALPATTCCSQLAAVTNAPGDIGALRSAAIM
jgi:hypothetical protein